MKYYLIITLFWLNANVFSQTFGPLLDDEVEFEEDSLTLSKSAPSIAVLNYENLEEVSRFKKFEIGVSIPAEIKNRIDMFLIKRGDRRLRLNPFVEWDVDLKAVFHHLETGERKVIDGFYTRDYLRVVDSLVLDNRLVIDDWVDKDSLDRVQNPYPFRVRFAPFLNGEWEVNILLKVKGELYHEFNQLKFTVVESGSPGYVKVHPNQVNLMRGDEMIYPIGHNLLAPPGAVPWGGNENYIGKNHFNSRNTEKATNTKTWNYYFDRLVNYFEEGGKYIRDIQTPWMSLIEFEEKGNYFKRLHYAQEMDSLIELCEHYDGLMNFNLMIHEPIMKFGDYDMSNWDWGHYNEKGEKETIPWKLNYPRYCYNDKPFGEKEPHEMFLDENDLAYHKQRTRYYIARFGYSTSIYEFEILSEPFHINEHARSQGSDFSKTSPFNQPSTEKGKEVRYAVYNYHKVLSDYMRDSLNINQLIGIDMGTGRSEFYNDYGFDSLSITIPTVDVVGINYYYLNPDALYLHEGNDELTFVNGNSYNLSSNSIASRVERIWYTHDYHNNKRIPVLMSEGGISESYLECSDYSQFYVDMMTFPFTNVAGYNAWYGWNIGDEKMREATRRTEAFLNSDEVLNTLNNGTGRWTQKKEFTPNNSRLSSGAKYPKETQYYVSEDQNNAVGYIRNLSYNARTTGRPMVSVDSTCLERAKRTGDDTPCYDTNFHCVDYNFDYPSFNEMDWFDYKRGKKIRVESLNAKTEYCIDFYSFNHDEFNKAELITTDCGRTNRRGDMLLKFPTLDPWNPTTGPVLWFRVRLDE